MAEVAPRRLARVDRRRGRDFRRASAGGLAAQGGGAGALAACCVALTAGVGGLTLVYRLQHEPADRHVERMYGNGQGEPNWAPAKYRFPPPHHEQAGEPQRPAVGVLRRPAAARHAPRRHLAEAGAFDSQLQACVDLSRRKEVLVFIHGFNVGFEDAARRTARIAFDLRFEGAPIFYSWPSQTGLLSYTVDETNVAWTVPHLKEFLLVSLANCMPKRFILSPTVWAIGP